MGDATPGYQRTIETISQGQLHADKPSFWPWTSKPLFPKGGDILGALGKATPSCTHEVCIFDGERFRLAVVENHNWQSQQAIKPYKYTCSYCGREVGSAMGWYDASDANTFSIHVCPICTKPTFKFGEEQIPNVKFGGIVENLPENVSQAYEEVRSCYQANAFAATVLMCRRILMFVSVEKGGDRSWSFVKHIEYLDQEGYLFKNSKDWIDEIRNMGNDATHSLTTFPPEQAKEAITFTEMLLRMVYEFPGKLKKTAT